MALINFKASAIEISERSTSYGPLPAGEYECMIVKSDTKPTKAGNGHYLELEMHVISGECSGRRHWERLNLDNPSAQTVKIAQEQLARLCAALGVDEVEDSEDLHDRAFIAEIGIDKKDNTRNVIWNYKSMDGGGFVEKPKSVMAKPDAPVKSAKPWG